MDPEQQTFLAGATLDPALYATSEPDQPALPQVLQILQHSRSQYPQHPVLKYIDRAGIFIIHSIL